MTRRPACLWAASAACLLRLLPLLLAFAGPAAAQGTDEERRACTPDAMRLCREYIPNVDAIIACMVARRAELSPECQAFIKPPQPTAVATAPAKPPRTAARSASRGTTAAKTRTAAKPAARAAVKPAAQAGRRPAAPMNLVPAAARPAPAKKSTARAKQAQRTQ